MSLKKYYSTRENGDQKVYICKKVLSFEEIAFELLGEDWQKFDDLKKISQTLNITWADLIYHEQEGIPNHCLERRQYKKFRKIVKGQHETK